MYDAKYTPQFWDGFGSRPSTAMNATLVPSTPKLSAMSPSTATEAGGGTAEITGANLATATSVTIGSVGASIVAATDGKVAVTIPSAGSNPTGTGLDVTVTEPPAGSATLTGAFHLHLEFAERGQRDPFVRHLGEQHAHHHRLPVHGARP